MQEKKTRSSTGGASHAIFLVSGVVAVTIGLIASSFGAAWSEQAYAFFERIEVMQLIGTYVPYFPFVPFYPIFLIMLGALLIVKSRG